MTYDGKLYFAASPHRTGVHVFESFGELEEWLTAHDGVELSEEQVDPELREAGIRAARRGRGGAVQLPL